MTNATTNIFVYLDCHFLTEPKFIGILTALQNKGRKSFSFEYNKNWLNSDIQFLLDPDIQWFSGKQFSNQKANFGVFLDSMPDTWGRTLMKRRHYQNNLLQTNLNEIDYLLGVFDESRMGGLRFKIDKNGDFLDNNKNNPTPPWSSIRELQFAANVIENSHNVDEINKWLAVLIAPGSSLGGARPKANVLDEHKNLWIAKFPSKNDIINKAAWEFLAYKLAVQAGIDMSISKIEKISGNFNTFFTKRFDRIDGKRIHFSSAMAMTGNNEENIRDNTPSYLEIAEFIQFNSHQIEKDLHQLWKRIVFNIAISNTDDHLRNHGFILTKKGWQLAPAYDINPSIDKNGLSLNIDMNNNQLDINIAKSVGIFFKLNESQMNEIIFEIRNSLRNWKIIAKEIGINRSEIELMKNAFLIFD